MPTQSLPPRKRGAGIQSVVAIVREILDSGPGLLSAGVTFFRGKLEIGHLSESAAARRPLLHVESPVRASEGSPGQARVGVPRAALGQRSDQFFSSPPESLAFGRFGGRGRERGAICYRVASLAFLCTPNISRHEVRS